MRGHISDLFGAREFALVSPDEQARIEAERDATARRVHIGARRRALETSGVIDRLPDSIIAAIVEDAIEDTPFILRVRTWRANNARPLLLLCGSIGSGKTVAAAYALAPCGGLFVTAHDLIRIVAAKYESAASRRYAGVVSCRMLVIDDIGREPPRDRAEMGAALIDVLDARQSMRRLTVMTSNLSVDKFKSEYPDPRMHSRMRQSAAVAEHEGEDMRSGPEKAAD